MRASRDLLTARSGSGGDDPRPCWSATLARPRSSTSGARSRRAAARWPTARLPGYDPAQRILQPTAGGPLSIGTPHGEGGSSSSRMVRAGEWVSKPPVDSGRAESLEPLGRSRHRAAGGPGRRGARPESAVRGARAMAKLSGVRPLPDPAEGGGPDGRAPGGPRADDQPRGGQGHRRGPARGEPRRGDDLGSAEEAKRIHGETIPVDGAPGGAGKIAFTPAGAVRRGGGVTPFNFPLNLGVPPTRSAPPSRAATPSS